MPVNTVDSLTYTLADLVTIYGVRWISDPNALFPDHAYPHTNDPSALAGVRVCGGRNLALGLSLAALKYYGDNLAVGTLLAAGAIAKANDTWVTWTAARQWEPKMLRHGGAAAVLVWLSQRHLAK